jgi:hypothetical protein
VKEGDNGIQIGKEVVKLLLSTDDMISYIDKRTDGTQKNQG